MKQNPFFGLSVTAMLSGCYLVSQELKVVPGQLGKLLALVAVLQLYEVLLVLLGVFLVRTGRARRDGALVLMLETLFLVDAPLLALECVSVDARAGTLLSVVLVALAAGKLALVRRALPDLVSSRLALVLGLQVALVAALPVVGVQLAAARLLTPSSLYGLWWLALALPLVAGALLAETTRRESEPGGGHRAWTWVAPASALFHLWSIGWIHQVPFQPAFLTPLLLGLALASGRAQVLRQILLPGIAVLLCLGQSAGLGQVLTTPTGTPVSALKVAVLGAGATYAALAWLHGYRWLVALAALFGAMVASGRVPNPVGILATLLRFAAGLVPRTALGWGATGIGAAFVLLGMGAWRSLGGSLPPPPGAAWWRSGPRGQDGSTFALVVGFLSTAVALSTLAAHSVGHPQLRSGLLGASAMAAASIVVGRWARSRLAPERDATGRTVASAGIAAGIVTLLLCAPVLAIASTLDPSHRESEAAGEVRTALFGPGHPGAASVGRGAWGRGRRDTPRAPGRSC